MRPLNFHIELAGLAVLGIHEGRKRDRTIGLHFSDATWPQSDAAKKDMANTANTANTANNPLQRRATSQPFCVAAAQALSGVRSYGGAPPGAGDLEVQICRVPAPGLRGRV